MNHTISVVGLGYVGLPLALALAQHFPVIGFDIQEKRIAELLQGYDRSHEIDRERLTSSSMTFTTDPEQLRKSQIIIVCVPTPITKANKPDLSPLESASIIVGKNLSSGSIVVYESTVYPGVTEEFCLPLLEHHSGLHCPQDFSIGYSPERMNPGDKEHSIDKITKVVAGFDTETTEILASVYGKVTTIHRAPAIKVAEAAKVIENIQRDLNIALMNELHLIFDKMGIETRAVLEAAGTKWNFHPYHPGLVGGHCFDKNSPVFLLNNGHLTIKNIGPYIDSLPCKKKLIKGVEFFYPKNIKVLSYDLEKNTTSFQPVTLASKRKAHQIITIKCAYNYALEVTDLHPVVVSDGTLKIKLAKDIQRGDKLVLNKILPSRRRSYIIDVLPYLDKKVYRKVRVKIKNRKIAEFKEILNKNIKGKKTNYYNWNYLPLEKYVKVEKKIKVSPHDIYLCTGRGPGLKQFPRIFPINNDVARLIGYYLSEGCITYDRSLRTRFTFHRKEIEYLADVENILKKLNIDYSIYHDKTYQSTVIKVSSDLFGFVFKDILGCGANCYQMQIPDIFFELNKQLKAELLKGLMRGDGGVRGSSGKRRYIKEGKNYFHQNNTLEISYFTSSPALFQQVILFLLNQDILPKLAKRSGYLSITGPRDVTLVKNWFLGDKKKKIEFYLQHQKKHIAYKRAKKHQHYITLNVEDIKKKVTDYVYSMEVERTHTLITSNGIIAHNCIGVDPYYLTHRAEELGYHPQVILAGRQINDTMHSFYVRKIIQKLTAHGRSLAGGKVVILGVTFKPNVRDYRNSRVKHLIAELKEYGLQVFAYDPFVDEEVIRTEFHCAPIQPENLSETDIVVLAMKHHQFQDIVSQLKENNQLFMDMTF